MQQRLGTQVHFEVLELGRRVEGQQDKPYVPAHVGWVEQLEFQGDLDNITGPKGRRSKAPRTVPWQHGPGSLFGGSLGTFQASASEEPSESPASPGGNLGGQSTEPAVGQPDPEGKPWLNTLREGSTRVL